MAKHPRKASKGRPITRHPLFPAAVALWFAALFGLVILAVRLDQLEAIVIQSRIDLLVPAAAPPLGIIARVLISVMMAMLGGALGRMIARGLARPRPAANAGEARAARPDPGEPQLRPRDSHPDAPARRPISAHEELGEQFDATAIDTLPGRRRAFAVSENPAPSIPQELAPLPAGAPLYHDIDVLLDPAEVQALPPVNRGANAEPQADAGAEIHALPPLAAPSAPITLDWTLDRPVLPGSVEIAKFAAPAAPAAPAPPQPAAFVPRDDCEAREDERGEDDHCGPAGAEETREADPMAGRQVFGMAPVAPLPVEARQIFGTTGNDVTAAPTFDAPGHEGPAFAPPSPASVFADNAVEQADPSGLEMTELAMPLQDSLESRQTLSNAEPAAARPVEPPAARPARFPRFPRLPVTDLPDEAGGSDACAPDSALTAMPAAIPAAMRPLPLDDPDYPDFDPEDWPDQAPGDENYGSLLNLGHAMPARQAFVRSGDPLANPGANAPVVIFPGQVPQMPASVQAEETRDGTGTGFRHLEAPADAGPGQPPASQTPANVNGESTERALRAALLNLQRIRGAA